MANPWFPPNGVSALSPPRLTTGDSSNLTPPIPPDPPDPDFPPLGSVPPKSPRFSSQTAKPSRPATKSFTPKTAAGSKFTGLASSSTGFSKSTVSISGSSAPLNFKILQPKHSSPIQTNKASGGSTTFPTSPPLTQNPNLIATVNPTTVLPSSTLPATNETSAPFSHSETKTHQTQSASQKGKNVPSETPTSKKPGKTTPTPSSTTFSQASTSTIPPNPDPPVPPNPDPPVPPFHSQPPKTPTQKNATPLASSHLLAVIPSPSKSPPDTFITPSLKRPRSDPDQKPFPSFMAQLSYYSTKPLALPSSSCDNPFPNTFSVLDPDGPLHHEETID
ncbi:hypothetical protein YC2023_066908 [Brassica napus]